MSATKERGSRTIWKKPWPGWRGFLAWWTILTGATFVLLVLLSMISFRPNTSMGTIITVSAAVSLGLVLFVTLGIAIVRWACCWRNLRRLLFGAACLATLIALLYVVENVRGSMAWQRYARDVRERGDPLELKDVVPPAIEDADNFFAAPYWEPLRFNVTNSRPRWDDEGMQRRTLTPYVSGHKKRDDPSLGNRRWNARANLEEWQTYYQTAPEPGSSHVTHYSPSFVIPPGDRSAAEAVLLALDNQDENYQLVIEAARRPKARFWINYDAGYAALLPHAAKMKGLSQFLTLHALAAAASGDADTAFEDVMVSLRSIEALRDEPILISHLVRIAMLEITMQAVWEGLADRIWTDQQLAALQAELEGLNFPADHRVAILGERAFSIWTVDYCEQNRRSMLNEWFSDHTSWSPAAEAIVRLAPKGWFELNKRSISSFYEDYFLPISDGEKKTFSLERAQEQEAAIVDLTKEWDKTHFFARMLLPSMARAGIKFALAQANADLATVAIALERHRLEFGEYPESLTELQPRFLDPIPHDVMTGESLIYRLQPNGRYILYSVGWDGEDDGGSQEPPDRKYDYAGYPDWVWELPVPQLQPY